ERFKPYFTVPTFRSGRRSLMIWACFTEREKGPLVFMKERNGADAINAQRYVE
ncbi:17855_t:CDS:1, partial [Cetraspora pellucida]